MEVVKLAEQQLVNGNANNPITELKSEHQAVKLTLRILGKIAARLIAGEKVEPAYLDQILEFLTTFVDKCHHGKEEDLLFPALEKSGVPKEGGPIGVMLQEHDLGRSYIRGLRQGTADYKTGDSKKAAILIVDSIRNYSDLLTRHIDKEDNILYPIAERIFTAEQKNKLLQGFAGIEKNQVGAGKHEEFHQMLHQLQEIYL